MLVHEYQILRRKIQPKKYLSVFQIQGVSKTSHTFKYPDVVSINRFHKNKYTTRKRKVRIWEIYRPSICLLFEQTCHIWRHATMP